MNRIFTRALSVGFAILTVTSVAAATDTKVGTVYGTGRGQGNDREDCCSRLSTLHNHPGNITDMNEDCRDMGGHTLKNSHPSDSGYCRPFPGRVYRVECEAPFVADCIRWN